MCGRFHNHVQAMHDWVGVLQDWPLGAARGYNVSPTQAVPILTNSGTITARWGLVPPWENTFSTKYPTHNARLETVADKPSFRSAWQRNQTCLIPTGGFFEWRKEGCIKQPYFIHKPDDLMVLAGLWQTWNGKVSFTILTTESFGTIANLHHRMPVMLSSSNAASWLESGTAAANVLHDISIAESAAYYAVSTAVNTSANSGMGLIKRQPQ